MKRALTTFSLALIFGFLFLTALCLIAGESPFHVISVAIDNSVLNNEDMSVTLFYATHLMFAATGLCIALQAGLFPIGAEGQISLACISTVIVGSLIGANIFGFIAALIAGPLAAGALGQITAYFKNKKGSHEVIVTMMLNFLCASLANYLVSNFMQSTTSQNPETAPLPNSFKFFAPLFKIENSPANWSFYLALLCCLIGWVLIYRTRLGFEIRTMGQSPSVASHSGMSQARIYTIVLIISATLCGFSAWNQILGYNLKYQVGFSADYGLLAIVVALIAGRNPLYVIPTSFFFAILLKGAAQLDIETDTITRDFVKIIEAFLILAFLLAQKTTFRALVQKIKGGRHHVDLP
jgi:general nucleoside transport system permease protein